MHCERFDLPIFFLLISEMQQINHKKWKNKKHKSQQHGNKESNTLYIYSFLHLFLITTTTIKTSKFRYRAGWLIEQNEKEDETESNIKPHQAAEQMK